MKTSMSSHAQPQRRSTFGALLALLVVLIGVVACAAKPVAPSGRPAWIDNPGLGVSASAGFHVNGRQAQEELAITRGREELAKRQGVVVNSDHSTRQSVSGEISSSVSDKQITEQVRDKEVRAVVKAKWTDPVNGVLWVWVVPGP